MTILDILPMHECSYYCNDIVHAVPIMSESMEDCNVQTITKDFEILGYSMLEVISCRVTLEANYNTKDGTWRGHTTASIPGIVFVQMRPTIHGSC